MKIQSLFNLPKLYSHKGTLVRLILHFDNTENLLVEPLKHQAGGLVLNPDNMETLKFPYPQISLLTDNGKPLTTFPLSILTKIESFVIYPDGSTWEGRIFEGYEQRLHLLLWSWELVKHMGFSQGLDFQLP
ncbi:hypothetical protein AAG747_28265 [Rapidithrix thailandica]|uniref:Uncharacterized protein n=1 Tax=Rapidithrix thailandica TaxID=413964 RepID=A0AAW9SG83_9BACT